MNSDDLLFKIALTLLPKVGPVTAKNLVSYCGGVEGVFSTPKSLLLKLPGVGPTLSKSILEKSVLSEAEKEIHFIAGNKILPLFFLDQDYPKRLLNIYDSPILLYFKEESNLNPSRTVGIVVTRTPTHQDIAN